MTKKRKLATWLFILAISLAVLEVVGIFICNKYEHLNGMRNYLLGSDDCDDKPMLNSHPYMGNVCTPLYCYKGVQRHNIDGYRGEKIAMKKDSLAYRILFLGGSTTYSVAVIDNDSIWSEQVKTKLDQLLEKKDGVKSKRIEVFNGGIPMGTSAELLTHYLFKYRYYQPDLVVIHSGINDALSYTWGLGKYNPDYSFWRKGFDFLSPISGSYRVLFYSRFIGALIISQRYTDYMQLMPGLHNGDKYSSDWFVDSLYLSKPSQNAFNNNVKSLIREAMANDSEVLLVPVIYNKDSPYLADGQGNGIFWHNSLLKQISVEMQVPFCDIGNHEDEYKEYWIDAVHLNAKGVELKSVDVANSIFNILRDTKGGDRGNEKLLIRTE